MLRGADTTSLMAGGLYHTIVENAVDSIVVIDRYGAVLWVNGATPKTFGYDEAELIGRNVSLLMPAPYCAQLDEYLKRFLNTGEPRIIGIRRELLGLRKDGSTFPIELAVVEAVDHEGLIFIGTIRDITARKRLEERFRQVIEAAPNAMVLANAEGKIEMINAQAEQVFGYSRLELIGQPVEALIPERFRVGHSALRADFLSAPQSRPMGAGRDLAAQRKDGSEFPVEVALSRLETDHGMMVLTAIVDLSARRQLERTKAYYAAIVESSANPVRNSIDMLSKEFPDGVRLTLRERVTLVEIMRGATAKQAARTLVVSPRTIEFHRANIMKKFGVRNVAELIAKIFGS